MLFKSTEVDIEVVERGEEFAEGTVFSELREGVDIFRETLAAVATFAVGTGDVGVGVVDVTGEKAARVDFRPIGAHLPAVLPDRIEVGHLVCAEDIVRVLRDFRLQGRHDREFL